MRALWEWLSDPTNQGTMTFIGGGLAVVVAAGWVVYLRLAKKKDPPPSPQIVNIGITLGEHHEFIKQKEDQLRAEFARASREEKAVLEEQLGVVEQQLANPEESYEKHVALLQERIVALEKLKGEFPEEVLAAAKAALAQGDTFKAEALFRQIEEKADAPIKQAAEAAYQRGRIAESRIDYRTAYAKFQRATQLKPDNADYHVSAGNVAETLGLYDEAIESHETALGLYRSKEGDQSVNVAMQWNNLGNAWRNKGEYDKAIEYFEKALKVDIATFGENHPKVAIRWNNLGLAWGDKGEYDKAIGYYEKALKVDIATFGENHPEVATDWNNLGLAWRNKGEYDKAIGYYEKALKVFERRLGKDHPVTRKAQANLRGASEARAAKKP